MADEYSLLQTAGNRGSRPRRGIGITSTTRGRGKVQPVMKLYIGEDILKEMGAVKGDRVDLIVSRSSGECRLVKAIGGRKIGEIGRRGSHVGVIGFGIWPGVPYTDSVEECEMLSVTKGKACFRLPENVKWGE